MTAVIHTYAEGSDILLTATYTDSEGAAANPSAVTFTTYRDDETDPVQAATSATIVDNVATLRVQADNVRVASGRVSSLYRIETEATIAGRVKTESYEVRVSPLTSKG